MDNLKSYRWATVKNGIANVAIIELSISENNLDENFVYESIQNSKSDFQSWRIGARKGLEYAFSKTEKYWNVNIHSITGTLLDTNPTVVGYTFIKAFFDKINCKINTEEIEKLEDFVAKSWTKPYKEFIPDFLNLTFKEYKY